VKVIRFAGECEIELIWAIQNIDIQIQKDSFWSVGNEINWPAHKRGQLGLICGF
jgi:hypothetical protein